MNFFKCKRGASAVEYGLLVALIAVVIIGAVVFLDDRVDKKFNHPEKAPISKPLK